ncbi:MAG: hypothetical protein KatS3mg068_1192 [Candidatus Sericytochromatia bacterium]|nr:MAG: hypothetical protein KatS3mg068_1192 [Candidatus Sericytochromatia bacterium]
MDLKNKISQLIFPEIRLNNLNEEYKKTIIKDLQKYKWGGYILFDGEANQAIELVDELQKKF